MVTPRVERRLAAILAADVVGYSRLVERVEASTLVALKALRVEVIDPLLAEHKGRIAKLMGDGAIVEFASVVDTVACAVAIQKAVVDRQGNTLPESRIVFRIGVNLGGVVVDGADLMGDGVNIAARLEQLCEPGGVLVSGTAFDHLQGRLGLPLEFTGEQQVKNIACPVRAYRVRLDGKGAAYRLPARRFGLHAVAAGVALGLVLAGSGASWWRHDRFEERPLADQPSIAVLPFENRTGEERLGRLADGMVGDIIAELGKSGMVVIGRGTSFGYRNRPHDARTVGQDLGVRYVLEGGLDGDGLRIRATIGLVDSVTGAEVWSERYDRPLNDLFAVQDELTERIVDPLGRPAGAIRNAMAQAASTKPADSLEAFDLMLLGRAAMFRFNQEDNIKAEGLLLRAAQLDPNLARAYMNLAGVYEQQVDYGWALRDQAMANWQAAAKKGVELAPENVWSRFVQARWFLRAGNLAAFASEIERAADLVQDSQLMLLVAFNLPSIGQSHRAADLIGRALRLDPAAVDRNRWTIQQVEFFNREFGDAAAVSEALTEPDEVDQLHATLIYAQLGRDGDVQRWRSRLLSANPAFSNEYFHWRWGQGVFVAPQAATEQALWFDSLAKAGLPRCATAEQLAQTNMSRLPECEAVRAKAATTKS